MTAGGKGEDDRDECMEEGQRDSGVRWGPAATEHELLVVRVRSAQEAGSEASGPGGVPSDELDAGLQASGLRVLPACGVEEAVAVGDRYGAQVCLVDIEPASPADLVEVCRALHTRSPDLPVVSLFPEDANHPVGVYEWGLRLCLRRGLDSDPAILGPLIANLARSRASTILQVGNVKIDKHQELVFVDKVHVKLTAGDVDILTRLFERRGVVPYRDLLKLPRVNGTLESAQTNVRRLGKKLEEAGATTAFERVRGQGFRVVVKKSDEGVKWVK